ncbi:MAG TPA: serine hydrolase [Mobilitalea sp.]|nr:serine hydrolase [Mobilitalea sp.]
MNRKSVLGLTLFACIVITGLFLGAMIMTRQPADLKYSQNQQLADVNDNDVAPEENYKNDGSPNQDNNLDVAVGDELTYADAEYANNRDDNEGTSDLLTNLPVTDENESEDKNIQPEDSGLTDVEETGAGGGNESENNPDDEDTIDSYNDSEVTLGGNIVDLPDMQLITDSSQVDYMKYIPEMIYDSRIEVALDIENPSINIKAKSAILFDADTRKVLYHKNAVEPVFPASTAKLLTALVALDWCMEEEEVTVGDELELVASDSTIARLKKGQILTIRNLIEGMLVPSGNDAAYVTAAYVGRKSLKNENASLKDAIFEFIKLMNNKAKSLGAVNSCFKTPDGYDAIGQYTTAYDMGLIGLAAADNEVIVEVCNKSSARNVFADGYDVTWNNTNSLIKKDSPRYYPYCLGLKTGTSTMAGKCLISLARKGEKTVLAVVMNSDSEGRWEDSRKLLDYGLSQ